MKISHGCCSLFTPLTWPTISCIAAATIGTQPTSRLHRRLTRMIKQIIIYQIKSWIALPQLRQCCSDRRRRSMFRRSTTEKYARVSFRWQKLRARAKIDCFRIFWSGFARCTRDLLSANLTFLWSSDFNASFFSILLQPKELDRAQDSALCASAHNHRWVDMPFGFSFWVLFSGGAQIESFCGVCDDSKLIGENDCFFLFTDIHINVIDIF